MASLIASSWWRLVPHLLLYPLAAMPRIFQYITLPLYVDGGVGMKCTTSRTLRKTGKKRRLSIHEHCHDCPCRWPPWHARSCLRPKQSASRSLFVSSYACPRQDQRPTSSLAFNVMLFRSQRSTRSMSVGLLVDVGEYQRIPTSTQSIERALCRECHNAKKGIGEDMGLWSCRGRAYDDTNDERDVDCFGRGQRRAC